MIKFLMIIGLTTYIMIQREVIGLKITYSDPSPSLSQPLKPIKKTSLNRTTTHSSDLFNCTRVHLEEGLWNRLNLNDYLRNYPDGKNLDLRQYADKSNLTNFICGIGQTCNAGQLCDSVGGPDWYIFVSTQNWNEVMNMIYNSISYGFGTIRDICPTMLEDLWPGRGLRVEAYASFMALAASLTACIPGSVFPGMGVWLWVFVQGTLFTTVAEIWFYNNIIRNPPDLDSIFTKWTDFSLILSNLEDSAQERLYNYTKRVIESGISSDEGLYQVLKDGLFLQRTKENLQFTAQDQLEQVVKLKLLNAILRAQGYYITRASDPCGSSIVDKKDLLKGRDVLSYCGEDGVMMSIVQAEGTKTKKTVFHGSLIESKYRFSTAFLTKSAWECQSKYGKYEYNPYQNRTFPLDVNAECLFNLPVCDCSREDIAYYRRKGIRTVKACMKGDVPVKLPPKEKKKINLFDFSTSKL